MSDLGAMLPGSTSVFSIVVLTFISRTSLPVSPSTVQQYQPVTLYYPNELRSRPWKPAGDTQNLWMKTFGWYTAIKMARLTPEVLFRLKFLRIFFV